MKTIEKLKGLIAAPFTPMNSVGQINVEMIALYAKHIVECKIEGVFICGTTGESASLTVNERKEIAEAWVQASKKQFKVIVHVGCNCLLESIELAQHADKIGADAIGAMAPYFFKPQNEEELVNWFKPIANSCSLPFYYYNMPSMTGVSLSVVKFLELGCNVMPTLCGVKFTHNNLMEMSECMMLDHGRFDILHGYDEILLCGLSLGAKAAVGSTYNYAAFIYHKLMSAFENKDMDEAKILQQYSVQIVEIIIKYGGGVRGGKAIMKLIGIDCGSCRLPIKTFEENEYEELRNDLDKIGFFDKIKNK